MNLPRLFSRRKNTQKSNFNNSIAHYSNCIASRFQQERQKEKSAEVTLPRLMLLHRGRRIKILVNLPRKKISDKILTPLKFSLQQLITGLLRALKLRLSLSLENYKNF
jgi:hypothetical protein